LEFILITIAAVSVLFFCVYSLLKSDNDGLRGENITKHSKDPAMSELEMRLAVDAACVSAVKDLFTVTGVEWRAGGYDQHGCCYVIGDFEDNEHLTSIHIHRKDKWIKVYSKTGLVPERLLKTIVFCNEKSSDFSLSHTIEKNLDGEHYAFEFKNLSDNFSYTFLPEEIKLMVWKRDVNPLVDLRHGKPVGAGDLA
jgi:hypothetical protein